MGIKTLVMAILTFVLFILGFSFLMFNQLLVGLMIMFFSVIIGALGWVIVWFGNDLSLLWAKFKFFKTGTKSLVFFKDKSNKVTPYFIEPSSKTFKVDVKTSNGIQKEPILVGKADGSLKGTNIATYWAREGVHSTFGMDDKVSLGMEGSYIHSLIDEFFGLGRKAEASGSGMLKKNGMDWTLIAIVAAVAFAAMGAYMAFNATNQLGIMQASIDSIKTALVNSHAVDANSFVQPVQQAGGSIIQGVI